MQNFPLHISHQKAFHIPCYRVLCICSVHLQILIQLRKKKCFDVILDYLQTSEIIKLIWWWWIVFVEWLTNKKYLALFPVKTIVRDYHHHKSLTPWHPLSRIWTCAEPGFRLFFFFLMKFYSSDNQFSKAIANHSFYFLPLIPPFARGGASNFCKIRKRGVGPMKIGKS